MKSLHSRCGTLSVAVAVLIGVTSAVARADEDEGHENARPGCPRVDRDATPVEVLDARNAALKVGNLDLALCYYSRDAVVLTPQGAFQGLDAIRAGLAQLGTLFGGAFPVILTTTVSADVLFITFSITGPNVSVVNGADTYFIRHGLIRYQTAHDPLTFP